MQYKHIGMQGGRDSERLNVYVSKTLTLFGITLLIWACGNAARQTTELSDVSKGTISQLTPSHTPSTTAYRDKAVGHTKLAEYTE